ncbi:hypothetical protein TSUD_127190 [Trifolium subterraneum]|nr:hypothetical protein TSUD_127190 [Trifolium subterraneum]
MSKLPKKYDSHDDKKDTSDDDSRNNKILSSKACNTEDTEHQRKHLKSDGECSRHVLLNDPKTKDRNQNQQSDIPKPKEKDATALVPIRYIPDLKNKHQRDQFDAIKVGMKFTGVIDGSFPGGYFITVGVGNCPTLSGVAMFASEQPTQIERNVNENAPLVPTKMSLTRENQNEKKNSLRNTENPDASIDINMDKIPHRLKVEDELISEYSNTEMLCSHEVQIPYKPIVFKPVNPSTSEGVTSLNQNTEILTAEQCARVNQLGTNSSSLNQNTSQQCARVPGNKNLGQTGSSSEQQGNNNVVIELGDHAQPNSPSPTSKKSKHIQDNY